MERLIYLTALIFAFASVLHTCAAQEAYQKKSLDEHNKYREKHHAPPLQMDKELNALAIKCADYYAKKKDIDHSCPYKNGTGENLAGGIFQNQKDAEFAVLSTKMWYDEVKAYDYNKPGFSLQTGHFTQVVWKNSTKLGFGFAKNGDYTVGVGLYDPPGNWLDAFKENVLKP